MAFHLVNVFYLLPMPNSFSWIFFDENFFGRNHYVRMLHRGFPGRNLTIPGYQQNKKFGFLLF